MATVIRRNKAKKVINFNLMVVGPSGSGKTTFINTLCETSVIPPKDYSSPDLAAAERTVSITAHTVELDEEIGRLSLTVLDTPGFGDNMNNEPSFQEILTYVEKQFDNVLNEESRIKRNTKSVDSRVHGILYFITPNGHGLREVDIVFMRKLGTRANILPVIAKSDSLTPKELREFKKKIRDDMAEHQLPYFNFPVYEEEDDADLIEENKALRDLIPFSVMGSDETVVVDGVRTRCRQYPWGTVYVDNPRHSDFSRLRQVLFGTHLEDLKEITHDVLYEAYRTLRLSNRV